MNERLICIADASTGFKYEQGNWSIRNFNVQNERYVVAPLDDNSPRRPRFNYKVTIVGGGALDHNCYRNSQFPNLMGCEGVGIFAVDFSILRFQYYFPGSYMLGNNHPSADTPFVMIGKCSQF
jgi:hypothetical protein